MVRTQALFTKYYVAWSTYPRHTIRVKTAKFFNKRNKNGILVFVRRNPADIRDVSKVKKYKLEDGKM